MQVRLADVVLGSPGQNETRPHRRLQFLRRAERSEHCRTREDRAGGSTAVAQRVEHASSSLAREQSDPEVPRVTGRRRNPREIGGFFQGCARARSEIRRVFETPPSREGVSLPMFNHPPNAPKARRFFLRTRQSVSPIESVAGTFDLAQGKKTQGPYLLAARRPPRIRQEPQPPFWIASVKSVPSAKRLGMSDDVHFGRALLDPFRKLHRFPRVASAQLEQSHFEQSLWGGKPL
jgi:hypothetical protein